MTTQLRTKIRPSAVAGTFYPANAGELQFQIDRMLTAAAGYTPADAPVPKAIISPHAGFVYSGQIAASVYARLRPVAHKITRVVIFGPAHRVACQGLVVPSSDSFATPLGLVPLDRQAIDELLQLDQVSENDEAHRLEHSLETQLPFLQDLLPRFSVVPIIIGACPPEMIAEVIDRIWGGEETLIVISSDLSHYHDYDTAQRMDRSTCQQIEALNTGWIVSEQACGARGINGLLTVAKRRDLRATTLDLRNSGDTAGPRDRVVGYGAWSFTDNASTSTAPANREMLLTVARKSIGHGLAKRRRAHVKLGTFDREIECIRASFVTLKEKGKLRGCIGSMMAHRPLVEDVVWNAYSAAFEDPRFQPISRDQFLRMDLSISILGAPHDFPVADEADLLNRLRPEVDGLILQSGKKRALFLPHVWEQLRKPARFVQHLKMKAGIGADAWPDDMKVQRFSSETFGRPVRDIKID